jgi:hypothetical protein
MMRYTKMTALFLITSLMMPLTAGSNTTVADEPEKPVAEQQGQAANSKESKESEVSFWMEKKMEYTQGILRGLATGDLKMVEQKAELMRRVSQIEGWLRSRKPGYKSQFQAFEFANAEILRNAKANNLDGAAIGFQQLTITCVSCHKLLRDVD